MVVTVLAAEPEGAFPMPCTAWAKLGAGQGLCWIQPFLPKQTTSSRLLPMFVVWCCAHLLLVSFAITGMLQGWTQAGMSAGLGCFTLANIRELIQASSLLTAWSTDYFICVMLQVNTKAHEPEFLLFTDWFWHFSGVVANLWLWLREQDCFLIHQYNLHHPVSHEVGFHFRSHFCPPASIAQNVFPLPIAAGSPNTPSAASISSDKEQTSLLWGVTGKPWSLLFVPCLWHYSSSLRIFLTLGLVLSCLGCVCCSKSCFTCLQWTKGPCLVPHTTWLGHVVRRETTGLRQSKPPALLKIQQMQGEQSLP